MPESLDGVQLRLVECLDDLFELKRWLGERREVLGVDTETGGFDWWRCRLRTVQLGDEMTGWTIPEEWRGAAREMLDAYDGDIVFHNMKFDLHFLELNGVHPNRRRIHDTRVMAHLDNSLRATGLKAASARLIHPKATSGEIMLKTAMRESGWTWDTVPTTFGPYWQYAALDPVLTARLYRILKPTVDLRYRDVYEMEIASTLVLTDMERRGARVDKVYCHEMVRRLEPYLAEMDAWFFHEFGIKNVGSDAQVIDFLHRQGITWDKKTDKGNVALDKEVLLELMPRHPIVPALKAYRDASKLLKTYIGKYLELADANDLIHGSVNPLGARTGRMSISRPSMQNLPRSQHPRNAIVPREADRVLGLIDYDQIEMRLLAHFANETAMIEAIAYGDAMTDAGYKGYDVHSMNARGIYGIGADAPVPKQFRQVTKNSGFAKIYGAGLAQFARTAGITEGEAEAFLARYDAAYPGVREFQGTVARVAAQRGYDGDPHVVAPSGRVHRAPKSKIYILVNYLIQGTAADVLKRKLIALDQAGLTEHLVLPVHDELIFDLPRDGATEYMAQVRQTMEDRTSFRVPLTADVELYERWGDKYVGENEEPWTPPDLAEMEGKFGDD